MLNRNFITNWKHAIGELVLIILGVSIALGASAWYENYRKQISEEDLLRQFQIAMQRESGELGNRIQRFTELKMEIDDLIDKLDSNDLEENTPHSGYASLLDINPYSLDFSDYEVLKSYGLNIVSNLELRTKLAEFYEFHYPDTEEMWRGEAERVRVWIEPFIIENFTALDSEEWAPNDFESLKSNAAFRNVSILKSARVARYIRGNSRARDRANEILELIEKELE